MKWLLMLCLTIPALAGELKCTYGEISKVQLKYHNIQVEMIKTMRNRARKKKFFVKNTSKPNPADDYVKVYDDKYTMTYPLYCGE